jgi:hypothetical protein
MYGDPDRLDALAVQVVRRADLVEQAAATLWARTASVPWVSVAADAFRTEAASDMRRLEAVAADLREAAARLREHADAVRQRLATIARAEHVAKQYFETAVSEVEQTAAGALKSVGHVITHPPWENWRWQPHGLPPPGDLRWLEVHDFLHGQGVLE